MWKKKSDDCKKDVNEVKKLKEESEDDYRRCLNRMGLMESELKTCTKEKDTTRIENIQVVSLYKVIHPGNAKHVLNIHLPNTLSVTLS